MRFFDGVSPRRQRCPAPGLHHALPDECKGTRASRMQEQAVDALGRFAALRAPEVSPFRSGVDGD